MTLVSHHIEMGIVEIWLSPPESAKPEMQRVTMSSSSGVHMRAFVLRANSARLRSLFRAWRIIASSLRSSSVTFQYLAFFEARSAILSLYSPSLVGLEEVCPLARISAK